MPQQYGYIRVSTQEQQDDRQRIALAESYGCDLTYEYVKINGEYRS